MAHTQRLLVLARLDPEQKRVLGVTATANELELTAVEVVEQALTWLDRNDPRIVVFDTALPRAEKLCAKVRSNKALAAVPIIGIAGEINEALAPKFFGMGADDLIPPSLGAALMARLRSVPREVSLRPPPDRGKAVIADADKARGDVFGRVLGNAGYEVKYALDAVSLKFYAQQKDLKLIVANAELGDAKALIEQAQKSGSDAIWIVTAQRRDLEATTAALSRLDRVRVMGLGVPPENVLFTSNELLTAGTRPPRATARILYGAVVAFRDAGADFDELGFTYNVSAGGVYVRTLAPPAHERVWLELRPPRSKQRVRLEGRVAWRRSFFDAAGATVPPGFGVEIDDGLGDGLAVWRAAYAEIGDAPARRAPPPPPRTAPPSRAAPPSVDVSVRESFLEQPVEELADAELLPGTDPPPPWPRAPALAAIPAPSPPKIASSRPIAPAGRERRRGPRMLLFVFVATGALVGAAAALFAVGPRRLKSALEPSTPTATVSTVTTASASAAPAVPEAGAEPAPADAAPPADARAASPAQDDIDDGGDGSDLAWNQGYLVVSSAGSFDVYSTGAKIGVTNTKNLSRCGLRYVRIGSGEPVTWKSAGQTVDVKCQAVTSVTIEPTQ